MTTDHPLLDEDGRISDESVALQVAIDEKELRDLAAASRGQGKKSLAARYDTRADEKGEKAFFDIQRTSISHAAYVQQLESLDQRVHSPSYPLGNSELLAFTNSWPEYDGDKGIYVDELMTRGKTEEARPFFITTTGGTYNEKEHMVDVARDKEEIDAYTIALGDDEEDFAQVLHTNDRRVVCNIQRLLTEEFLSKGLGSAMKLLSKLQEVFSVAA